MGRGGKPQRAAREENEVEEREQERSDVEHNGPVRKSSSVGTRCPQEGGAGGEALWRAGPALRDLVVFRELNLFNPWPMRSGFQAIFCRNTVIYFDEDAQRQIWGRMTQVCEPGGVLYIGHSERVTGTDLFRPCGLTTYRRAESE